MKFKEIKAVDETILVPDISNEDLMYLELKGGAVGILDYFFEQGMETGAWIFYDPSYNTDNGYWDYYGQQFIKAGDMLTVYNKEDGEKIYDRVIYKDIGIANSFSLVEQIGEGLSPDWFYQHYPAIFTPA